MAAEPETILQPSLHTMAEYADLVLTKAEFRGVDVADLRMELEQDEAGEFVGEIIDDTFARFVAAGYAIDEAGDMLIIMPRGVELPEEWME